MRGSGTGQLVPELPRVLCGGLARPALSPETWRPFRGCRLRLPPLSPTPTSSMDQPWRAGSLHPWVTTVSEHRGPAVQDWQSLPGGHQPHDQVSPVTPTPLQAILPVRSPRRLPCEPAGAGRALPFHFASLVVGAQWLSRVGLFATPMDCSPPGSSGQGILRARILEWVAISSSRGNLPVPGIELASPGAPALHCKCSCIYPRSCLGSPEVAFPCGSAPLIIVDVTVGVWLAAALAWGGHSNTDLLPE